MEEGEKKTKEDPKSDGDPTPKGKLIVDATCTPADIKYPTDLNLLNEAREKQKPSSTRCILSEQNPHKTKSIQTESTQSLPSRLQSKTSRKKEDAQGDWQATGLREAESTIHLSLAQEGLLTKLASTQS